MSLADIPKQSYIAPVRSAINTFIRWVILFMVKVTTLVILTFSFPLIGFSQPNSWQPPLRGNILLAGTFGELRSDHFHSGIDIKPNVPGSQEILAVADGYVREIRVRGGSYGNALILQHRDGYQSLYGHLDHFIPALDSLVYAHQYAQEKFEVTLKLDSTQFPVTRGMHIATMGNTGYSFGRHLHFEIRHPSGTMYNPLLAIPELQDHAPPQFRNLKINYYDDHGREYQEKIISVNSLGGGRYTAGNLVLNAFKYSIAIDVVDLHHQTHNHNGIYSLDMYRDSILIYHTLFDSLSQSDRHFYPEYIDHICSPSDEAIYQNLRYSANLLQHTIEDTELGLIRPYPFQTQEYTVKASDYQGNMSTLTFSVRQVDQPSIDYAWMYNYVIETGRTNQVKLDKYSVIFPEGTFLENQRLYIFEEEVIRDNEKIVMIYLNENQLPLYQKPLLILNSNIPLVEKKQWTLARCAEEEFQAVSTIRESDRFATHIGELSNYCLVRDSLPPEIKFHPQYNNLWHFQLSDNLHSFSSLTFSATVDGRWTLVEADNKNNRLIFRDFSRYDKGHSHQFRLMVEDGCGNKVIFDQNFK